MSAAVRVTLCGWKRSLWAARDDWAAAAVLAIAGLVLFLPAIRYQFTYFDDRVLIVKDAAFISDWRNLPSVLSSDVFRAGTVAYRPGLIISFMADALWGGIAAWAFHLSNILIHIAATCLLLLLLRMTGSGRSLALALAGLFLVHPLQAQAVAWIPGRNDSLLGLFVLLALAAYLRYLRGGGAGWMILHLAAVAAALLVKEAGIAAPAVCGLLLMSEQDGGRRRVVIASVMGWAVIGLSWFIARNSVIAVNPEVHPMIFNTLRENVAGLTGYIGKAVIPARLSVLPVPRTADAIHGLAGLAILFLLLAGGVRRPAYAACGAALAVLFMAPHLMRGTSYPNFLEHRMYVPLAGICLLVAQARLWERLGRIRPAGALAATVVIGLFAARTGQRLPVFADSFSLLNDAIEAAPRIALPYSYLGSVYIDRGEYDVAEVYLDRAMRLEPFNKDHYQNLGIVYQSTGRPALAAGAFERGIALAPGSAGLRYCLGLSYQENGQLRQAAHEYRNALLCRPGYVEAELNLGMVLHLQGDLAGAARHYRRVIQLAPRLPDAWRNLAVVYQQRGQPDSAASCARIAESMPPRSSGVTKALIR